MKRIYSTKSSWLMILFLMFASVTGWGQVILTNSGEYIENFDNIGSELPNGWSLMSNNNEVLDYKKAKTAWNETSGGFKNFASADGLSSTSSSSDQSNSTDRAIGVRQTGSFGNNNAAFVFRVSNTIGYKDFKASFKLQSLDTGVGRTATWKVEYAVGSPNSFSTIATTPSLLTTSKTFSNTFVTVDFSDLLDDKSSEVWIRISTIGNPPGSGNRPSTAIDDFSLTWNIIPTGPTLTATPTSLSGFEQTLGTVPSEVQTFTLSGSNLDTTSVDLFSFDGFEISEDNVDFGNELSFTTTTGDLEKLIYVRLNGTDANPAITSSILIEGGGYDDLLEVDLSGIINPAPSTDPILTVTPAELSGFSHYLGFGPSEVQSFVLSGANLDATAIKLTTDSGFEISLDNNVFGEDLTIHSTDGTLNQTIFVQLNGTTVGSTNNASILIFGGGDNAGTEVTLSGEVLALPDAPFMLDDHDLVGQVGVAFTYAITYDGEPITFTVTGGDFPAGLTLSDTGVISGTPTVAGEYNFDVTATDPYNQSGTGVFTFNIAKGTQTVTLEDLSLVIGGADVTLPELTEQGFTINYTSSNENVASIIGNTLTIGNAGTATITASNDGNANYEAFTGTFEVEVFDGPCEEEGFEGFETGSYGNHSFTKNNNTIIYSCVDCYAEDSSKSRTGLKALRLRDNNSSSMQVEIVEGSVGVFNAYIRNWTATASSSFKVEFSINNGSTWSEVLNTNQTWFDSDNYKLLSFEINGVSTAGNNDDNIIVKISKISGNRIIIDDISWNCYSPAPSAIIWDGFAWSNGEGPTASDDVIIVGALELTEDLAVNNISVTTGSIVVTSGNTLTVNGNIETNDASSFVVENDANLIQTSETANLGEITVVRNSTDMVRLDYAMWSSPVAGQNVQGFSPDTLPTRIYTYEGEEGYEVVANPATATMEVAKGYLFRTPNTWWENDAPLSAQPYIGSFVGTPNNGNISINVHANSYTSIGNPYPSNINSEAFLLQNSGVNTLYFWTNRFPADGNGGYTGDNYVSCNSFGCSNNYDVTMNEMITVGQGFIVEATSSEVNFSNDMRTSANGYFLKAEDAQKHRFWLNFSEENQAVHNQILIGYMTGATNGVDTQIDAKPFDYNGTALYSLIDEENYVIQGRALPFETSDVVALGFIAEANKRYTIELANFDGLFAEEEVTVFLKDKELGIVHNLMESAYTFEANESENKTRFEVVYETEGEMNVSDLNNNDLVIYAIGQNVYVKSKSENIQSVQLFDIQGRNIHSNAKVNAVQYELATIAKGVVVVKVETANGQVVTKKVIVK